MSRATRNRTVGLLSLLTAVVAVILIGSKVARADDPILLPFDVKAEAVFKELTPAFCWFHPRIAPLPGFGKEGRPAVVMTLQKHLSADDHYSGMYPEKLQVLRRTEKVLLPERGVMLGNFGATEITPDESWVTDSEYILTGIPHAKGADGTTWLGRVQWSKPNRLVK